MLILLGIHEHLRKCIGLLHLVLVQLPLQLVVFLDLMVEHHGHAIQLLFQLLVVLGQPRELPLHCEKFRLLL